MCAVKVELDQEWVDLILAARRLGLTKDEIRSFLERERTTKE